MNTETEYENFSKEPDEKDTHSHFFQVTRKMMLAGIGAAALAQDEAEGFIKRLVDRGEIAEKDGRSLMHEVLEKRRTRFSKVEDEVTRQMEKALNRMNAPTKADIDALSEKIAALSKKIDEMKQK